MRGEWLGGEFHGRHVKKSEGGQREVRRRKVMEQRMDTSGE